jgi:hypothetical protein
MLVGPDTEPTLFVGHPPQALASSFASFVGLLGDSDRFRETCVNADEPVSLDPARPRNRARRLVLEKVGKRTENAGELIPTIRSSNASLSQPMVMMTLMAWPSRVTEPVGSGKRLLRKRLLS